MKICKCISPCCSQHSSSFCDSPNCAHRLQRCNNLSTGANLFKHSPLHAQYVNKQIVTQFLSFSVTCRLADMCTWECRWALMVLRNTTLACLDGSICKARRDAGRPHASGGASWQQGVLVPAHLLMAGCALLSTLAAVTTCVVLVLALHTRRRHSHDIDDLKVRLTTRFDDSIDYLKALAKSSVRQGQPG